MRKYCTLKRPQFGVSFITIVAVFENGTRSYSKSAVTGFRGEKGKERNSQTEKSVHIDDKVK